MQVIKIALCRLGQDVRNVLSRTYIIHTTHVETIRMMVNVSVGVQVVDGSLEFVVSMCIGCTDTLYSCDISSIYFYVALLTMDIKALQKYIIDR